MTNPKTPKGSAKAPAKTPAKTPAKAAARAKAAGANAAEAPAPTEHALAKRIAQLPQQRADNAGPAIVSEWLKEIGKTASGKTLAALLVASPKAGELLAVIAGNSTFLWDLATADAARLAALLVSEPEQRFAALLSGLAEAVGKTDQEAEAMRLLRRAKSEAALLIALTDIGGIWPVMQVTRALTDFADAALAAAARFLLREAAGRGQLKLLDPEKPEQGSGYIVLAMGKMGAFELNYSSDIDLIVIFEPEAPALLPNTEPSAFYVRMTRALVKLLQERTEDGYVFRVDLRLRPDPASTQAAVSAPSALTYYESVGQNWERAAMIKARTCAGDIEAGEALLKELSPFIWRKYLDFAAVADVHAMKGQIHAYKGHGEIAVEGHNIKLGRGGIREIEFFVQTQQLIAGGRHPELRGRETLKNLAVLAESGFISARARDDLDTAYKFLRMVEHRLQMIADEQTHTLPAERAAVETFAHFLGFESRDAFADILVGHLRTVQDHYAQLFEHGAAEAAEARSLAFPPDADDRETLDKLHEMGFRQSLVVSTTVREWLAGNHRALRGEFARQQLSDLVPLLLEQLARLENPDAALGAFDRFIAGLHGGGRMFSLLRQNPELLGLVSLTLGTAPRLADILAQYPQAMDALIDPAFFGALPDEAQLTAGLERSLGQSGSYEDFLDRIRMFGQEHMFLIGARILSGTLSAEQAGGALARLADVLIRALYSAVAKNFAANHGHLRREETAVLAFGKLGGREMTASSDLDLILVYDFDDAYPESDGAKALYGGQYFARLTQRFVSALTAQTTYGALYQVDMRLRPSGRSGPLATQLEGFLAYQEKEAWAWEHMALTRARVVLANPDFAAKVEQGIRAVLCRPRDTRDVAGDVVEMRRAIAAEHGDSERWDLKYVAGGLIDLEFIAQYLQLVHAEQRPEILDPSTMAVLEKAARLGLLSPQDADVLRPAARLYHSLTQILRLCLSGPFDRSAAGPELLRLLARAGDVPDFANLDAHLGDTQTRVRQSFVRILGAAP